jgi:outer membrane receptor protein involved in Fe transport
VRAEANTDFGDSLGTPVSPRVGLSFVQPVGGATLKLRSSWGRAIRAPSPGYKVAVSGATSVQLANPQLGPEQQEGWDGGIDAVFGTHGSLSVTYYDQTAKNLIQFVRVQSDPVISNQYQNVGRVKNTGIEVEGSISLGQVQLQGQYGYSRARVEELGPNYTGNLAVGDQVLATPKHTAGARISAALRSGTTLTGGLTYVGSFRETDLVALFRCFAGTGPCQPTSRGYLVDFPGFVKVNAGISQQITPMVSGFFAADNLTNSHAHELSSTSTVTGRITTIGLRLHY